MNSQQWTVYAKNCCFVLNINGSCLTKFNDNKNHLHAIHSLGFSLLLLADYFIWRIEFVAFSLGMMLMKENIKKKYVDWNACFTHTHQSHFIGSSLTTCLHEVQVLLGDTIIQLEIRVMVLVSFVKINAKICFRIIYASEQFKYGKQQWWISVITISWALLRTSIYYLQFSNTIIPLIDYVAFRMTNNKNNIHRIISVKLRRNIHSSIQLHHEKWLTRNWHNYKINVKCKSNGISMRMKENNNNKNEY